MKLEAAICPFCNGDLRIPDDRKTVLCMYCGKTIIVQEAITKAHGPSVENLIALAAAARKSQNNKEAYKYYTKALELDSQNYGAWFYKGETAGWQSTLADFRLEEMVSGIEKALKFAPPEEKEAIKSKGAIFLNNVTVAYHTLTLEHMNEFGYSSDARSEYFDQNSKAADGWFNANFYDPTNTDVIDNMISLCLEYIEGVEYKDCDGYNTVKVFRGSNAEKLITPQLNKWITMRKAIDPSYQPPTIKKKGRFSLF